MGPDFAATKDSIARKAPQLIYQSSDAPGKYQPFHIILSGPGAAEIAQPSQTSQIELLYHFERIRDH